MSTQKSKNRNVRKLTKVGGNSLYVTLPRELLNLLGWKERQKVVVVKKGKSLVISDFKK